MAVVVARPVYTGTPPVVLPKKPNPTTVIHYPTGAPVRTTLTTPKKVVTKKSAAAKTIASPVNASQNALMQLIQSYRANLISPAQQAAMAKQQTDSQIKLALAGIQSSTAADQAYQNQQATRAQGFAEALRSMGQNDQQAVASLYNDAANREQGLGTGLTGAVADAYKQQSDASAASTLAATGGLGHLGSVAPDALRNVAQFTGVTLPAKDLTEEAANQGAAARWRDSTDAGKISNIATDYLSKAAMDQKDLALQRAQLETTRPDLYSKALESLQTGNRSDMATIIQALALMGTQSQIPGKIANTAADTTVKTATAAATKTGAAVKTATASHLLPNGNLDTTKYYWSTPNAKTRVPLAIPRHQMIDPNDPTHTRTVPNPADPPAGQHYDPKTKTFVVNPKSGSSGGTTASQVTSISNGLPKIVQTALSTNTTPPILGKIKGPVYKPKYTWAVAYQRLLNLYPADVRGQPRVKQAAINALTANGYVQPKTVTKKKTATKTKTGKKKTATTVTWGNPAQGAAGRK